MIAKIHLEMADRYEMLAELENLPGLRIVSE